MGCCGGRAVAHGAVGLAKAALGLDRAGPATVALRREICRGCEFAEQRKRKDGTLGLTTRSRCRGCHDGKVPCFIAAKSLVASEKCPMGKWQEAK